MNDEYYEKRREELQSYFTNHVAGYTDHHIERLVWNDPETTTSRIIYVRDLNTLFVKGDLGCAVYRWMGKTKDLQWMSRCSLDYWASKCEASENGRQHKIWDEEYAAARMEAHWTQVAERPEVDDGEAQRRKDRFDADGGPSALRRELNWHWWLDRYAEKHFEMDWGYWAPTIGKVISRRCQLHLMGLRQAIQYLSTLDQEATDE